MDCLRVRTANGYGCEEMQGEGREEGRGRGEMRGEIFIRDLSTEHTVLCETNGLQGVFA